MSKFPKLLTATAIAAVLATPALAGKLGLGRPALPEEIAAWNVDVSPDGTGLPVGSGSVADGETIFSDNCAVCHGDFAEGVGNWPKLAGGFDTLNRDDPVKTVGSYWPYLSTTWDYIHRSMPFGAAQTMSTDDVYAIVAYILYSNDIVDEDFVLSNENFLDVKMPNADGFIVDDRPETEYSKWRSEPCMTDCKDKVEITMRATVLDVTPEHSQGDAAASDEAQADAPKAEVQEAKSDQAAAPAAEAPKAESKPEMAAADPALIADGEKVFRKCKACHEVGEGAKNKTGPELNGILGRVMGSSDGFRYSKGFKEAHEAGRVWDQAALSEFLSAPKAYMKGTKMSFAGLKKDDDIKAILAYLSTFHE